MYLKNAQTFYHQQEIRTYVRIRHFGKTDHVQKILKDVQEIIQVIQRNYPGDSKQFMLKLCFISNVSYS